MPPTAHDTRAAGPPGRHGSASAASAAEDGAAAVAGLAETEAGVLLIGVRHHAPSLAAAVPALLDRARPDVLLVELPAEFQPWLPWLAHEETAAPVALAAAPAADDGRERERAGEGLAFYPFADFSPELAALRWAARSGVDVVACDLPLADPAWRRRERPAPGSHRPPGLADALSRRLTGRPGEDLWDRLVEARAPGSSPEAVRRAALGVGWALRHDAERGTGVEAIDLRRERWMRARIREATAGGGTAAVLVGAFHAPALVGTFADAQDDVRDQEEPEEHPGAKAGHEGGREGGGAGRQQVVTSLIPYAYPLLDERSGYPAGIRDPEWQHAVLHAAGDPEALTGALTSTAVRICVELRAQGHPSGPPDAREIIRTARDLAALRGLPAPGRGELVEAVQTVLTQGEPLGRGRAVAQALERILVGSRTGRTAPGAPRSGLAPAVETALRELGLPGPHSEDDSAGTATGGAVRDLRLDPLRSDLDRRRELLLQQLAVCGVPYAEPTQVIGTGGADALTTRWRVGWTPAVGAMLAVAGTRGVTAAQAAEGALRIRHRQQRDAGGPTPSQVLAGLRQAAACGIHTLTEERLAEVGELLPATGTLPELLEGLALLDRLGSGHIPGLAAPPSSASEPPSAPALHTTGLGEVLTAAAVRQIDGLTGSDDPADARALVELARRADALGGVRLSGALGRLAADGSPLMRGAAGAVRVLLGHDRADAFGTRAASWIDAAGTALARTDLARLLTGALSAAGPLLESAPETLSALLDRVNGLPDSGFLDRLPALRAGFDTLSPAARDRLLAVVEERLGDRVDDSRGHDPVLLAAWTRADLAGRTALVRRGLLPTGTGERPGDGAGAGAGAGVASNAPPAGERADRALAPVDRWRLVLGRRSDGLTGRSARLATALDELYGSGRGEGSRGDISAGGPGGGREAPYPGVREWSDELAALFGPGVREEVLEAAVALGRADAVTELDPAAARPSVELLRTVLDHAGGLPEARLAHLRPLVDRIVAELTRELATRLRPALTGLALPRPSRRPGGGLDLARTLRANLATARRGPDGTMTVVPERPVFRSRARRSADWRLVLVVDVSGSMEASTVWSALTASILAGVPALSTHFIAFSTEVVDLTGNVHDPLGLLLEVRIGGGTHIAAGLRHARSLATVPSRTLVVVVSDFEEGYPIGGLLAETRALVDTGCHVLGCASLDDRGRPRYSTAVAGRLVAAGMPVAALSPLELARWVGEKVR